MLRLKPLGVIRTPFASREGMPIQPKGADGVKGTVEVFEPYRPGLKDLDGFSHLILLYQFHKSEGYELELVPFMDTVPRGVFATRAPRRPNPIGLSIVRLEGIEGGTVYISEVDILDGAPLLDIKPYVPQFDQPEQVRSGWIEESTTNVATKKSDGRFL